MEKRSQDEGVNFPYINSVGIEWEMDNIRSECSNEAVPENLRLCFNTNNGVLAFVDEKGKIFVADSKPENVQRLIALGYRHSYEISVPFSNGEVPVLQEIKDRLHHVFDTQRKEPLPEGPFEVLEGKILHRKMIDKSGKPRIIFSYNNFDFVFKGKDEIVELDEEVELVDNSLRGVLSLAEKLGFENIELVNEIRDRHYSPEAIEMVDMMIASNHILNFGDDFNFLTNPNQYGTAMFLLAILGDDHAKKVLDEHLEKLREFDLEKEKQHLAEIAAAGSRREKLKPEDLVVTFSTRYIPKKNLDGEFEIPTSFDADPENRVRNSIHTALNHKVNSHGEGSWADAGYMVISPFTSMVEKNGIPHSLNTVDTWWLRNPGEPLTFPDSTLVRASEEKIDGIFQETEREMVFQSGSYTFKDYQYALSLGNNMDRYMDEIFNLTFDVRLELEKAGINMSDINSRLPKQNEVIEFINNLAASESEKVEDLAKKIVDNLNLPIEAQEVMLQQVTRALNEKIFEQFSREATNRAIRGRGFQVKPGGSDSWGNSWAVHDQTIGLANELGTSFGRHHQTPNSLFEESFDVYKEKLESGDVDMKILLNHLPNLDKKTRRIIYAEGYVA